MSTIPLFKVHMNSNTPQMVGEVLMSGMITQSKKVDEFENKLKEFFNWPYVLTLNSATSGLTMAYRLFGVKQDHEVLSTPLTCFATTCAILAHSNNIIWVDTDPETCNIDLDDAKSKITEKTKALSFVHWSGVPVDLDKVNELKDYAWNQFGTELGIVEDCAHSFGAEWKNRKLGTHGNIAVYSLQAIKHLTTGDGGLILLPNEEMYKRAKLLRWYGIDRERRSKPGTDFRLETDIIEWGYKFHMNDINATIGLANLPDMNDLIEKGRSNATWLDQNLGSINHIKIYNRDERATPSFWIYTIRVLDGLKPFFIEYMKEHKIVVSQVHARNDKHSCVKKCKNVLPNLNQVEKEIVSIPCGWWVTKKNLEYMKDTIIQFSKQYYPCIRKLGVYEKEYANLVKQMNNHSGNLKRLTSQMRNQIYILTVNGEVVSTAKLLIENKICDPIGHIEDVVTDEKRRGLGFGKLLVQYLINTSLETCYKVTLSARPELEKFYTDCGLCVSGLSFTKRR